MKKTFMVITAAMLLAGSSAFAEKTTLIDFSQLTADLNVTDANGVTQPVNRRTVQDYAVAAGSSFTSTQKSLMRTSLSLPEWEVELNSSARSVMALAESHALAAPVSAESSQPFAGQSVLGVRVVFPAWSHNASARIVPPYEIQGYEPLTDADDNGVRQAQTDEQKGKYLYEEGYGLIRNVGTIKSISVTTFGDNFPHKLYVLLKDNDNTERRYYMGTLQFDGWKTLIWNNPNYIEEVRAREVRVYPIYPRGLPYIKFAGFEVTRDAADIGNNFVAYFKQVDVIYDKAILSETRDIVEEDLWGVVTKEEADRKYIEMSRFGNKQVDRYIERAKEATEDSFTHTDYLNPDADSNGQESQR